MTQSKLSELSVQVPYLYIKRAKILQLQAKVNSKVWVSVTAGRQTRALGCKRGPCRSRAVSRGRAPAPPAPVCVCVCPHFSRTSDLPAPRLQIQPHSALNPTSPNTRSNLTQLQIQPHPTPDPTPSSKTKTTQHQTQPPTATNPTPLSTKSNLTQQQILTHPTPAQAYATPNPTSPNKKFNLTQLEIQPHTTPNPTLPSS